MVVMLWQALQALACKACESGCVFVHSGGKLGDLSCYLGRHDVFLVVMDINFYRK